MLTWMKYHKPILLVLTATIIVIPLVLSIASTDDENLIVTPCDRLLDPAQLSPQDGQTIQLSDPTDLAWAFLPSGVATTSGLRWTVDLIPPMGEMISRDTDQMWLLLSAFGVEAEGGLYRWRVRASYESSPSDRRAFCSESTWFVFHRHKSNTSSP